AIHGARGYSAATLGGRRTEALSALQETRVSPHLPGVRLPLELSFNANLAEAMLAADDIILATPSDAFTMMLTAMKPYLTNKHTVICASKGLDAQTGRFLHEVFEQYCPRITYGILSGPSFALEVAEGLP
ncbi:MAG: glycerol-3-phosphate dehydrogenase, partial [Pseudomonadota bacterium]